MFGILVGTTFGTILGSILDPFWYFFGLIFGTFLGSIFWVFFDTSNTRAITHICVQIHTSARWYA